MKTLREIIKDYCDSIDKQLTELGANPGYFEPMKDAVEENSQAPSGNFTTDLKKSAIQDIKNLDKTFPYRFDKGTKNAIIEYIKEKFNLTKEDLK